MTRGKLIEKDLNGSLPTQPLADQIRAEILQAHAAGAESVDIIIRRVAVVGGAFPEAIIDYGGELLQTLAKAIRIINDRRSTAASQNSCSTRLMSQKDICQRLSKRFTLATNNSLPTCSRGSIKYQQKLSPAFTLKIISEHWRSRNVV